MASLGFSIVGITGNIISFCVFTSHIKTFSMVVKKKSTENYKSALYVTSLLWTNLWTFYGFMNLDGLLLVTLNATGAAFQCIYVTLFLIYAPKDKKEKTSILVAILNVGFLGAVIHQLFYPLIKMKRMERMPFLLSFFLFLNAGIWLIYAVLVKDLYIAIPSVFVVVLGTIHLIPYAMYKKKTTISAKSTEGIEEEGSANVKQGDMEMQVCNDKRWRC